MSITKHFEETFYLGFEDLNLNRELKPKDILFSELIFLRITKDKLIFHYPSSLTSQLSFEHIYDLALLVQSPHPFHAVT